MKACPVCGARFDPLQGKYAPDGTVICAPCGDRVAATARQAEAQNNASAFIGSFGSVATALASFCVQNRFIFFLFPVIAMAVGVGTALTALRNPAAAQALGAKRIPTIIIGSIGAMLGLLALVFNVLVNFVL